MQRGFNLRIAPRIFLGLFVATALVFNFKEQPLFAARPEEEIEVVADNLQFVKEKQKIVASGNVVVTHGDLELSADQAVVMVDSKEATAEGHVILRQRGKGLLASDKVSYNFEKSTGSFPNGRFYHFPWYGYSEEITQEKKDVIKVKNAHITSCDLAEPHYTLNASEATLYTDDKIVAKNITFRILGVPVFWWPYLSIPLRREPGRLTPGYSNDWGGFVLATKGFSINKNIDGRLLFDWYSKRGFGFGGELRYRFKKLGAGDVKIYGIHDNHAPNQREENPFENKNRSKENRGRVSWRHKMKLDPMTTLQTQWHEISDDVFLEDFFEREHRAEIDPQSFATLTRNAAKYSLLAHYEKRTNRFQSVDEKLPEVVFTWLRRPLYGTNFYYTNEEGFVNFNKTQAFRPRLRNTIQFYSDHELSYPLRIFDHYTLIPFSNLRFDDYTKGRLKEKEISRSTWGLGFDLNTRFYRQWDYKGEPMGIQMNGLRHVLEPIISYNSIKAVSVDHSKIINTGRGDDIDLQDILTFGVENRIQTKHEIAGKMERVDLVSFNTFLDYSFGPGSDLLRSRANKFLEARIETELRPYDWLRIKNTSVYSFVKNYVESNSLDMELAYGPARLGLLHRYNANLFRIRSEDVFNERDSSVNNNRESTLTLNGSYVINSRWQVGGYVRWEAAKNTLEEWEIRGTRDLHDWLLDFGYNVRNSDRSDVEKELNREVFVELKLKAVPEIDLKSGHRASFSEPRIGRTVSGANEASPPLYSSTTSESPHLSLATP